MNRVEIAEQLIGECSPQQAALVYAVLALVEEQQTTNELLRLLVAKDTAVDFDEAAAWEQYQMDTQQEYVPMPATCFDCGHTEKQHGDGPCTATNEDGTPCGCQLFDDVPF